MGLINIDINPQAGGAHPDFAFDEENHLYTMKGEKLSSVTEILKDAGLIDTTWFTDEARDRGSAVHAALEYADQDDLDESSVDESILPYIQAAHKFQKDSGFVNILIEPVGFHPIHRYAGKPDRVGIFEDWLTVIDYKTSDHQDWHAIQLAGYEAVIPYLKGSGVLNDIPFLRGVKRIGVSLRADATYRVQRFDNPNDFRVFLACQVLSNWKRGR